MTPQCRPLEPTHWHHGIKDKEGPIKVQGRFGHLMKNNDSRYHRPCLKYNQHNIGGAPCETHPAPPPSVKSTPACDTPPLAVCLSAVLSATCTIFQTLLTALPLSCAAHGTNVAIRLAASRHRGRRLRPQQSAFALVLASLAQFVRTDGLAAAAASESV